MYKHMKAGCSVVFTEWSQEQVNWGGNDDPKTCLVMGNEYVVDEVEVHSQHTKVRLVGHEGLSFNSVHFRVIEEI